MIMMAVMMIGTFDDNGNNDVNNVNDYDYDSNNNDDNDCNIRNNRDDTINDVN